METDLSLIEISGEDDSLLSSTQQSPTDVVSHPNNSFFSCSPLLQTRSRSTVSPFMCSPITEEEDKPSCSNREEDNSMGKENVNGSKQQEAIKLCIEPQQMKRKKRGGGFNLRKSIAWNRAFFTDEGVLDQSELSMLNNGNSGKMLSAIHEGGESLSGDLLTVDSNLSKPPRTPGQGRKVSAMSPKLGSPARHNKTSPSSSCGVSQAKRKILTPHDSNRSASKRSGCPRPVGSSSVRRILNTNVNTNTTKVVAKDARVSKRLVPKTDSVASTSSRCSTTSAGLPKRNVISQPGITHRTVGLKGTSTDTKIASNSVKSGPDGKLIRKPTGQPARRNMVKISSVPEIHSSSSAQLPQVGQVKNSLKVIPDSAVPVAHPARGHDSNTRNIAASFSQNACNNVGLMQPPQPQKAKTSGLRMPSPSLGFFGQSKPSERSSQASSLAKSNIPSFNRTGALNTVQQRPPRPSGNIPVYSSMIHSVAPTDTASNAKIKSNLELSNRQNLALQLQSNPNSKDSINQKQKLHTITDDVNQHSLDVDESCKIKVSSMKKLELQKQQNNDTKLSLQIGPCEQPEKGVDRSVIDICLNNINSTGAGVDSSHFTSPLCLQVKSQGPSETKTINVDQHVEDILQKSSKKNLSACSEPESAEVDNFRYEVALEVHEDELSGMHEARRQCSQQVELMNPDICITDSNSDVERSRLNDTLLEKSKSSEELSKSGSLKPADVLLEVQEAGATSYCPSLFPKVELTEDGSTGIGYSSEKLHAGDAEMLSVEGDILVESGNNSMDTSAVGNSDLMDIDYPSAKSAEEYELPNSCILTEQDTYGPLSNDDSVRGVCSEYDQEKNLLQSQKSAELRKTNDRGGDLGSVDVPCLISPLSQDCGFNEPGIIQCIKLENALVASIDSELADNNNVKLCGEANTLASERMEKSNMTGAFITDNPEMNILYPNRGDLRWSKLENLIVTTQNNPIIRLKAASGMTNKKDSEGAIDKQYPFSDSQPDSDACSVEGITGIQHTDRLTGVRDVREQTAEETKLINFCSQEAEQVNHSLDMCDDDSRDKCRSLKDVSAIGVSGFAIPQSPHLYSIRENELAGNGNMEDALEVSLDESSLPDMCNDDLSDKCRSLKDVSAIDGNEFEIPQSPQLSSIRENELAGNADMEDALEVSLDESSLGDSYSGNKYTFVEKKKPSLVCVDTSKEHAEIQNFGLVIEQVPVENHGLCLNDNLVLMDSSVEPQETNNLENVSGINDCPREPKSSNDCSFMKGDVDFNMDADALSIQASVENIKCHMDSEYRSGYEIDNQACPSNLGSSSETNEDQMPLAANTFVSKAFCSLNEQTNQTSNEGTQQDLQEDFTLTVTLSTEAEINIHRSNGNSNSELQNGLESVMHSKEVEDAKNSLEGAIDIQHTDCSTGIWDVKEQTAEQAKLINSCSQEAKQVNRSQDMCDDDLTEKGRSLKDVGAIGGSGFKITQSPQLYNIKENELAGNTNADYALEGSLVENSLADRNSGNKCTFVEKNKSPLVCVDTSKHAELRSLGLVIEQVPVENHDINDCPRESKSSDDCPFMKQDAGFNMDMDAEPLSSEASVENGKCRRSDYELENQAWLSNLGSLSETNENQMPLATNASGSKAFCSLNEQTNETSSEGTQQDMQEDLSLTTTLPAEVEINIHLGNGNSNSELQNGLESVMSSKEVEDTKNSLKKSGEDKKQDTLVIKPPSNAVPFSDEWLAAFEAAGEEILAKKGGAVQNSPPDKSLPEASPWSPVKRRNNQELGPYDCTKFTNPN
ncbi:uncharacterized protein LOC126660725 isoform X2 [Mercurialis annua]|uniref:uncharacterized protein LOC126660725 isoform X2 n=1 Tax=Mercurialis annua TaxID=3986 RepID=UPI00216052FF|nr:uncharacterized protein LOC126660725 isoform X2 [Mercurialis annua]